MGQTVRITVAQNGSFKTSRFADDVLVPHKSYTAKPKVQVREITESRSDITFESLKLRYDSIRNELSFNDLDGKTFFTQNTLPFTTSGDIPLFESRMLPDEGVYGFGEWFNGFRREQAKLVLYNQESPAFMQHKQTYSAFPCFISDRGYMILILNSHRGLANIDQKGGLVNLSFEGGVLDYIVTVNHSLKKLLSSYTALTGRPPMLPMWSFGLWNTAYPVENQEQTLKRIADHREKKIPLDALIFDYHWEEGFS